VDLSSAASPHGGASAVRSAVNINRVQRQQLGLLDEGWRFVRREQISPGGKCHRTPVESFE